VGMIDSEVSTAAEAFAAGFGGDLVSLTQVAAALAEIASRSFDAALPPPTMNLVVDALAQVSASLAATMDVVVDRWDRAGAWAYDGALSGSAWLSERSNSSRSSTRSLIQTARRLRDIPVTFEMMRSGRISRAVASHLAAAHVVLPDAFATAELSLLEAVEGAHERDARRMIDSWIAHAQAMVASNEPEPQPVVEEPSVFILSTMLGGKLRLEGEFDALSGQIVRAAIENLATKDDDTTRSLRERLADGLVTLAALGLDSGRASHAQRPHVVATMTINDFETRTGTNAHFADGTPVPEAALWQLFCDADIHPLLTKATGAPLAMGRAIRLANQAQRLALAVQWGGCGFPGCDQPAERCQVHHEKLPWDDGGLTDVEDLTLLCHGHHRVRHRVGWKVVMEPDGTVTATRPDGYQLIDTRRRTTPTQPEPSTPETAPTRVISLDDWFIKRTSRTQLDDNEQRNTLIDELVNVVIDRRAS